MHVLLTGSSGFIGNHYRKNSRYKETITPFSFQYDNIGSFDFSEVDTLIHLAALVHQMNGADPESYHDINVAKTIKLAQKAKASGIKHFIFMSTVKVYGEENDTPYTETSPCSPQDEYGKSKLLAERELEKLSDENFLVSIIRTPIVYGYGVKANIKNLIELVNTIPILPLGNIDNKRSMVYIGNLCHLIDEIIAQQQSGIFLASDDEPLSTSKLIRLIAKNLEKNIYLIKVPLFETLLKIVKSSFHKRLYGSLEVDNLLTKEKLNLKNPYTLEESVRLMIQGTQ